MTQILFRVPSEALKAANFGVIHQSKVRTVSILLDRHRNNDVKCASGGGQE